MIDSVTFKNFRLLRDVTVDLERFTLIAGPNACGKSSVLLGLNLLHDALSGKARRALTPGQVGRLIAEGEDEFNVEARSDRYIGAISTSIGDDGRVTPVRVTERETTTDWREIRQGQKGRWLGGESSFLAAFEVKQLTEASYDEPTLELRGDGRGLPTVLATMAAADPEEFVLLKESVAKVIPSIRKLRLVTAKSEKSTYEAVRVASKDVYTKVIRTRTGYELRVDTADADGLRAGDLSEGTLLCIALLAVVVSPTRPRVLLIDGIERGLHPRALGELVGQLRTLLVRRPDLQVVATTHSPYMLDHFEPPEIRLMSATEEYGAECAPLMSHPDFNRWKDEMAPGEFWSMVGEDWIRDLKKETPSAK